MDAWRSLLGERSRPSAHYSKEFGRRLTLANFADANADEILAEIVYRHLVEHSAGFVVMKRPAEIGAAALGRGAAD
jgi:hypothetical protein